MSDDDNTDIGEKPKLELVKTENPQPLPEKPKRRAGRPPLKLNYEEVERQAARGLTKKQICLVLKISVSALQAHEKNDAQFLAAMERGRALSISAAAGKIMSHIEKGNVTALIFFLKAVAGWKDTSPPEAPPEPLLPNVDAIPDEEIEKLYSEYVRLPQ